jgi:hypothetical protein
LGQPFSCLSEIANVLVMFVALHVRVLRPVVGALRQRQAARERERRGGGQQINAARLKDNPRRLGNG